MAKLEVNFDGVTGKPDPSDANAVRGHRTSGPPISVPGHPHPHPTDPPRPMRVKEVIPCTIILHKGSDCITFYIGGVEYTYCW